MTDTPPASFSQGMGVCKVPETGYVILCERALPGERLIGRIFKNHRAYSEVRPLVPIWSMEETQ